jgi:hypothetical protein
VAGHIVRIFDNRIPKGITEGSLGRQRLVDKQKNRVWKDAAKLFRTKIWCAAAKHSD